MANLGRMIILKKYPLREIKDLQNSIIRKYSVLSFGEFKISNVTQCEIIKNVIDYDMAEKKLFQKDLESILNIRKSTISGILETMEKNKIITRVQSNEGKIIRLSDEAASKKEIVFNLLRTVENELIEGIEEEELEIFFKVIDMMKKNINKKGID